MTLDLHRIVSFHIFDTVKYYCMLIAGCRTNQEIPRKLHQSREFLCFSQICRHGTKVGVQCFGSSVQLMVLSWWGGSIFCRFVVWIKAPSGASIVEHFATGGLAWRWANRIRSSSENPRPDWQSLHLQSFFLRWYTSLLYKVSQMSKKGVLSGSFVHVSGFCEELKLFALPPVLPASGRINFQELSIRAYYWLLQESPPWISNIKALLTRFWWLSFSRPLVFYLHSSPRWRSSIRNSRFKRPSVFASSNAKHSNSNGCDFLMQTAWVIAQSRTLLPVVKLLWDWLQESQRGRCRAAKLLSTSFVHRR